VAEGTVATTTIATIISMEEAVATRTIIEEEDKVEVIIRIKTTTMVDTIRISIRINSSNKIFIRLTKF
jgi:hypothetical protein